MYLHNNHNGVKCLTCGGLLPVPPRNAAGIIFYVCAILAAVGVPEVRWVSAAAAVECLRSPWEQLDGRFRTCQHNTHNRWTCLVSGTCFLSRQVVPRTSACDIRQESPFFFKAESSLLFEDDPDGRVLLRLALDFGIKVNEVRE